MTKLQYPEDGMYNVCRGNMYDADDHLATAGSDTSFDIPSGFPQRDYLYGLGGKIQGFRDRLDDIGSKLRSTDNNMNRMTNELKADAGNLVVTKVQKRDRMIV